MTEVAEQQSRTTAGRRSLWTRTVGSLSSRQVNLLLAAATSGAVVTGLVSWAVGTGWSRWWTALHATCGVLVVVLAPAKARRSVRAGMRRRRPTRWISVAFGVIVMATVALGFAHSTGVWTGVGYWTSLWTHFLLAFASVPLLVWHLWSRPVRPKAVDLDRRLLIGGGAAAAAAAVTVAAVEGAVRVVGLDGAERRFTGSHEIGSFDPDVMPTVSWIDDRAPATRPEDWELRVDGLLVPLDDLRSSARPVDAVLDCTGGWWSEQRWDVVPISELLAGDAASFDVMSATGYARRFPMRDAESVFVAVGYDGRRLRRGHGAPVRIVAPGRRGPWWVKWVVSIEPTDRPWWFQLPFPLT
ncbi:MAG: molybdopterin-dependent oxidoreductase [Ilumatobacter sp.]|uniref:molybdopterin-dependent oxidoreductase n=1 Tax=Ilumatobacter sp. TaxID=1967498 RepID=UPI00262E8F1B|nr:molybdopterin-dependent oxidoreductase [Ilumatobacter sp.]MDJ0768997.1 molybdopterin-dependent oxidoreductase [Ilumatobacter sp.]